MQFLTGGDVLSGTYPEIRFENYIAGMYLSAETKFKVVPPSQFNPVGSKYEEMSLKCITTSPDCTDAAV